MPVSGRFDHGVPDPNASGMAEMTPETWDFINSYSLEVFGVQDDHLADLMV